MGITFVDDEGNPLTGEALAAITGGLSGSKMGSAARRAANKKSKRKIIKPDSKPMRLASAAKDKQQKSKIENAVVDALDTYTIGDIIDTDVKPKIRPQKMEAGGAALVGGQVKLDKNKDGKISGADFRMMEEGGEAKVKKRKKSKKSKGNMCRGGGAALRGTSFSGVK